MDALKNVHKEKAIKDTLVKKLTEELHMGLEDRLLGQSNVIDHGARFTTFAMTINAARENLLLEEGLAEQLENDLIRKRQEVITIREKVKNAHLSVKKVQHLSDTVEAGFRKLENRKEESFIEEINTSLTLTNAETLK
ncbi:MAG: hypothetical protein ABJO71_02550 [Pseudoruegeria sp.]